jgi:hypothetical protein
MRGSRLPLDGPAGWVRLMPSALVGRPGEDVEAVVSMLLCRRFERAARRRPGQGDRGVDVFVPLDDGRIDVYQVKRYDHPLNAGQWRKVKDSYETLIQAVADGHLSVRNWYLTMPLDASDSDESKFAALTADAPFELCEWRGKAWLDALASEFPGVVDYYLNDGKERLEQTHRDLMAVLGARDAAPDAQGVAAVGDGLAALYRTLNDQDPLYRYDFAVGAASNRDMAIPDNPPGSLVFAAQVSDGEICVTWHVHARCDESIRERPIPIGLQFDVSEDPGLQESLRLFAEYGKPFLAPAGTAMMSFDLPGGLGGSRQNGSVRYVLRLRASRPDVEPVSVRLAMDAPTVGSRGVRLSGSHDGGAFAFEALHEFEPPMMRLRFSALELTGQPVALIIGGVNFMLALRGARLEVAAEYGPFMPFGDGIGASDAGRDGADDPTDSALAALAALYEIQQHTPTTVLVPDLTVVTVNQAREWDNVARLLRGETISDHRLGTLASVLSEPPERPFDGDNAFMVTTRLVADLGDQQLSLGEQVLHVDAATVRSDSDEPARLTVTPKPGRSWTRTRIVPTHDGTSSGNEGV